MEMIHSDGGLAVPAGTGKPSLGDYHVVAGLVSDFMAAVVEVRKGYNAGDLSSSQAVERIDALAAHGGDIFMGRNPEYAAQPWNDPRRLGIKLRVIVPGVKSDDDPGKALFEWLAKQQVLAMIALESGSEAEESVHQRLAEMASSVVDTLVGATN